MECGCVAGIDSKTIIPNPDRDKSENLSFVSFGCACVSWKFCRPPHRTTGEGANSTTARPRIKPLRQPRITILRIFRDFVALGAEKKGKVAHSEVDPDAMAFRCRLR